MRKILVFSTVDNSSPYKRISADMFSTVRYEGMHLYHNNRGDAALLMRSEAITPMPWCLCSGRCSSVFFPTYNEARDYCKRRGYRLAAEAAGRGR